MAGLTPIRLVFQLVAPTPDTVWALAGWARVSSHARAMSTVTAVRRMIGILAPPAATLGERVSESRRPVLLQSGCVRTGRRRAIAAVVVVVAVVAVVSVLVAVSRPGSPKVSVRPVLVAPAGPSSAVAAPSASAAALGAVALTGCPPPPRKPPVGGGAAPRRPPTVVPEAELPAPPAAAPRVANLSALAGKGMWIWQPAMTEGGDVDAIVKRAANAGLTELWVRVGDSLQGFYGASFLDSLVPAAHRRGLSVIGWGFPYLYDPVGDAAWSAAALAWTAPGGGRLDGFSADIESSSEGTMLSARRTTTYLGLVRPHSTGRPLVATVYQPTDYWLKVYPYQAMAPYVDAFAPMVYWSCVEPGAAAIAAVTRLSSMAPVHLIGQAFDDGPSGGRVGSPAPVEISRFLDAGRRSGAAGASFWVWQSATAAEWTALADYPWNGRPSGGTVSAGA
jgi:hypothetical protein